MTGIAISPDIAKVRCIVYSKSHNKIMLLRDANPQDEESFAVEVPLETKDGTCSDIYLLIHLMEQFTRRKFHAVFFTNEVTLYFRDDTTVCEEFLENKAEEEGAKP